MDFKELKKMGEDYLSSPGDNRELREAIYAHPAFETVAKAHGSFFFRWLPSLKSQATQLVAYCDEFEGKSDKEIEEIIDGNAFARWFFENKY